MRIRTSEEIEKVRGIIGDQDAEGLGKLLADGGQAWVFRTNEEVEADQELDTNEKDFCRKRFASGETWAGITRLPRRREPAYVPGITPHHDYDTHGNYRGGGGGHGSIH